MSEATKWVQLMSSYRAAYSADKVYAMFYSGSTQRKGKIALKIGVDICKKLGFSIGDTLGVFYDPDNYKHLKVAKIAHGYKLSDDKSRTTLRIMFNYKLIDLESGTKHLTNININEESKILELYL